MLGMLSIRAHVLAVARGVTELLFKLGGKSKPVAGLDVEAFQDW